MNLKQRIAAFVQLGKTLSHFAEEKDWPGFDSGLSKEEFESFNHKIQEAKNHNQWFTVENTRRSIGEMVNGLKEENLEKWTSNYDLEPEKSKRVGVIMAGNIPIVGWHDMVSVLISGHRLVAKLSSDDRILLPEIAGMLTEIEPEFKDRIEFVDRVKDVDAVIATGSNNTARYFDYYFGKYPNIIRKNRNSIAIIDGDESEEDLKKLGDDVFTYFGLGCRNVSKLYLPEGYDLDNIFKAFYEFKEVVNHNKYGNNYDYNKAIFMMNQDKVIENGFLLMKEAEPIASPMATMYYEFYSDKDKLKQQLKEKEEEIQCIVSKDDIPFGKAQSPELWDYADGVDTLKFLSEL